MKNTNKYPQRLPAAKWVGVVVAILLTILLVTWARKTATPPPTPIDLQNPTDQTNKPPPTTTQNSKTATTGDSQETQTSTPQKQRIDDASNLARDKRSGGDEKRTSDPGVPYLETCLGENVYCDIEKGKDILIALDKGGGPVTFYINGVVVEPKTIQLQLNQKTYKEDTLVDATGRVLLSSNKEYIKASGQLRIKIGMEPRYYQILEPGQRRTLYLEQIVRTFMSMLQENPNDFITTQQAVSALNSWKPKGP